MRSAAAPVTSGILLRRMGHRSELYALTIDEELEGEVRPFSDPASRRRRHHDLSLRAALADDRRVRTSSRRPDPAVSQRHAGPILRSLRSGALPPRDAGAAGSGRPGRPRRSGAGRVRVQPAGARCARIRADGRFPPGRRYIAHHQGGRAAGARTNPGRRFRELPLRRPDRAEQGDRGSHPPRGALQAVRRQSLPLHLRGPLRRGAAVLFDDPGADVRVPDAERALRVHRSGAG